MLLDSMMTYIQHQKELDDDSIRVELTTIDSRGAEVKDAPTVLFLRKGDIYKRGLQAYLLLCRACQKPTSEHAQGACLFQATTFDPVDLPIHGTWGPVPYPLRSLLDVP